MGAFFFRLKSRNAGGSTHFAGDVDCGGGEEGGVSVLVSGGSEDNSLKLDRVGLEDKSVV